MEFFLRDAEERDLEPIRDIFNESVRTSTCTYRVEPETADERLRWFGEHKPPYCVLVAEVGGRVAAWASLSRYRPGTGYAGAAEDSIYVHPDFRKLGAGKRLLQALVERAKRAGFHTVIAVISADQIPSLRLHEGFGFTEAGRLREVGAKFGRVLDVVHLQNML